MKRTLARATAVAIAVVGLSMAPAAATTASLELPGSPTVTPVVSPVTSPGGGEVTPQISFCQVVGWWYWCRV
ncbi:MAG TPA: hypothetical protein VKZ83_09070 [Phototrophicaceae bacterium]|nr:hypothetical protein [Phototrophicaceae bacterium]